MNNETCSTIAATPSECGWGETVEQIAAELRAKPELFKLLSAAKRAKLTASEAQTIADALTERAKVRESTKAGK